MPIKTAALFLLSLIAAAAQDLNPLADDPPAGSAPSLIVPPLAIRPALRLGFTRDGKALFTQDQQQVLLWDVDRGLALRVLSGVEPPGQAFFGAVMNPSRDALWFSRPASRATEKLELNGLTMSLLTRVFVGQPFLALAGALDSMLLYRDRRNGKVQLTAAADRAAFRELPSGPGHWRAASLNPKGHTAAIGNYDGHLLLYDYDAGKTLLDIPNPDSAITQVEFSADGKLVAALLHPAACLQPRANTGEYALSENCTQRSTVLVWDAQTGKPFYSANLERVYSIALGESGQTIALGLLKQVRIVNMLRKTTSWTLGLDLDGAAAEPGERRFVQVALSPDGRYLAAGSIGPIRIFDLSNGRIVRSLADPPQAFAGNSMLTNTGRVLMAQNHPTRIVVTELSPGASTRILESQSVPVGRPLISLDGSTLASRTSVANRRSDDSLRVWNIATRQLQCRAPWTAPGIETYEEMALSDDGSRAVIPVRERDNGEQGVELWDVRTCRNLGVLEHNAEPPAVRFVPVPAVDQRYLRHVDRIAISPSGRYVSWATNGNDLHVWDTVQKRFTLTARVPVPAVFSTRQGPGRSSNQLRRDGQLAPVPANLTATDVLLGYDQLPEGIVGVNFGSSDSQLATLDADGIVRLWDPATGKQRVVLGAIAVEGTAFMLDNQLQRAYGFAQFAFSPDGRTGMAVFSRRNDPVLWDLDTGKALRTFRGFFSFGCCANFSPDGKRVLFGGGGSHSLLSDVATGQPLARIGTYGDGSDWLVWRDDGLFDGSAAAYRQPGWVFNSNSPNRLVLPMDAFFADFFRPGLLPDILAGRSVAAARDLSNLDRRQARVQLDGFARLPPNADPAAPLALPVVTLRIRATLPPADERRPAASAIRDLRLFRNGSLVHSWRGDLKADAGGVVEVTTGVPMLDGPNEFVAYGFNQDNVKSASGVFYINGAASLARKANAHVIVIGINDYENPEFRLKYAAPDAQLVASELADNLKSTGRFANVNVTTILDEEATRQNLLSALVQLGGGAVRPGAKRIPGVNARDTIFIFFAGHGWARDGRFYLIPRDLGYTGPRARLAQDRAAQDKILKQAISDLELGSALELIRARDIVLIVDACNAGQLLESSETRQGPFNSKGLAQLAWEKGMYILTAAQSYQAALESSQFGHGYLTQALLEEGLKQRKADRDPLDGQIEIKEWFDFASLRVPELQRERQAQTRLLVEAKTARDKLQTPRAFYRAGTRTQLLVSGAAESTGPTCAQESSLKSSPSQSRSVIQWTNTTSSIRKLYLIDAAGNRSTMTTLAPGAQVQRDGFIGQIWMVVDESERCAEVFTPRKSAETAAISK